MDQDGGLAVKDGVLELAKRNGQIHIDIKGEQQNDQIEDLEKSIYQIQERMSVEVDGAIIKQVREFMDKGTMYGRCITKKRTSITNCRRT